MQQEGSRLMDKGIVKESGAAQAFQWIVGLAAAAAFILIAVLGMGQQLNANLVLWSSASIVITAAGGLLLYLVAAITGATHY